MGDIEIVGHPSGAPDGIAAADCLWVDDAKVEPYGFAVARTYDDALRMCRRFKYRALYLDHDLGERRTGLDLLRQLRREKICPPHVECISWNPVGRANILAELRGSGE